MKAENILSVGGFLFQNEADASLARIEEQKIKYIEARMDYANPESIRYVYEKAIKEKLFRTPVGMCYLKQLRDYVLSQPGGVSGEVSEVALDMVFDELKVRKTKEKKAAELAREEKAKARFTISILLNALLVCAIAAMFLISLKSDTPNIINYERALLNKYASWEEELTEREQRVREKELELKIHD